MFVFPHFLNLLSHHSSAAESMTYQTDRTRVSKNPQISLFSLQVSFIFRSNPSLSLSHKKGHSVSCLQMLIEQRGERGGHRARWDEVGDPHLEFRMQMRSFTTFFLSFFLFVWDHLVCFSFFLFVWNHLVWFSFFFFGLRSFRISCYELGWQGAEPPAFVFVARNLGQNVTFD